MPVAVGRGGQNDVPLDGDEFAHWTNPESFATSVRNRRKRREWLVFNALKAGEYKFFDEFHEQTGQGKIVAK